MKTNPLNKGVLTENFLGIGTVTRKMVRERAVELAVINGRNAHETSKSDWEQAKRELTGGSELDPQEAMLESLPETKRWDPLPGSTGHQAHESSSEEQDEDGQSESAQLVEEGVREAGHDQMFQAVRANQERD